MVPGRALPPSHDQNRQMKMTTRAACFRAVSKDQNVDSGDIGLAYGTMDPLGAGEYSDITGSDLELPEEIDSGNWYVAFIADADLEVDESNENNNVAVPFPPIRTPFLIHIPSH